MSNRDYMLTQANLFKKYEKNIIKNTNSKLLNCIFSYSHTISLYSSSIQDYETKLDTFLEWISEK